MSRDSASSPKSDICNSERGRLRWYRCLSNARSKVDSLVRVLLQSDDGTFQAVAPTALDLATS